MLNASLCRMLLADHILCEVKQKSPLNRLTVSSFNRLRWKTINARSKLPESQRLLLTKIVFILDCRVSIVVSLVLKSSTSSAMSRKNLALVEDGVIGYTAILRYFIA